MFDKVYPGWLHFLLLLFPNPFFGQSDSLILLKSVTISGNRHTKDAIIQRQITLKEGTVFSSKKALEGAIALSRQVLNNTGLFREINIRMDEKQKQVVDLVFELKEAWNFFPIPYFKLADRNFNVWWVQQNRALNRVNLGIRLYHRNLLGFADQLKWTLADGYNRTYQLEYRFPFLDKAMKTGLYTRLSFQQWREINYDTKENKQQFFRKPDNSFLSGQLLLEGGLTYRPAFQSVHTLVFAHNRRTVDAVIAKGLNPDYLLEGAEEQVFTLIRYQYQKDDRDNRFYPLNGYFFQVEAEKIGLFSSDGRNALNLFGLADFFWAASNRVSLSAGARGKYAVIRRKQPYYDNRAMGFTEETTLRGYEYHLVDGLDMGLLQTTARILLFKGVNTWGKWVIEAYRTQPYRVFFTFHSDWGLVNHPFSRDTNPLDNKLLWSYGAGINLTLYFDMVARVEYSRNIDGGKGVFLKFNASL